MAPPAVILVRPQLAENVGTAIRAMANFGLEDLRLVSPRFAWPDSKAVAAASGALERADIRVSTFQETFEAVLDLQVVHASTARTRALRRPTLSPKEAGEALAFSVRRGESTGILFGPENAGLANEELNAAEAVISIPAAASFRSLNLAMAVLLTGYEWHLAYNGGASFSEPLPAATAEREDLDFFLARLLNFLKKKGFFYPSEKAPRMERSVRAIFTRNRLTDQELRTLHGIVSALVSDRKENNESSGGTIEQ